VDELFKAEIKVKVPKLRAEAEYRWLLALEGVLDRTVRWVVEHLPEEARIGPVIEEFKGPVGELFEMLPDIVVGSQRAVFAEALQEFEGAGYTTNEAQKLAALRFLGQLMEVVRIARDIDRPVADVGHVYCSLAEDVDFARLADLLEMKPRDDKWEQRAAQGLLQDLAQARRDLTLAALATGGNRVSVDRLLVTFRERHAARLTAMQEVFGDLVGTENIRSGLISLIFLPMFLVVSMALLPISRAYMLAPTAITVKIPAVWVKLWSHGRKRKSR